MRARYLRQTGISLLLLAAGSCASEAPSQSADAGGPTQAGELTALTYNVAGLPEPLSGSEPSVNTPLISPLLNPYDLVLVQEDWQAPDPNPFEGTFDLYHDLLAAEIEHPHRSEPAPLPLGSDPARPDALVSDGLNRFSSFPFGDVTRVGWEGCFGGADTSDGGSGDCLAQKGFSVATHTLGDGVEVDVYNLHGEAGGTAEDERLAAADFAQLGEYIAEHSAGRAVILGGDTNLHAALSDEVEGRPAETAVWREFLDRTGLTDVCEVVDCGDDAAAIDRFAFRSSETVAIEPLSHNFERDTFVRADGEPLSDHDALAVAFAWEAVG